MDWIWDWCKGTLSATGITMITVLYMDDEPDLLDLGKLFLERHKGFMVDVAPSAKQCLSLLAERAYDAIVSDYMMPEMNGIELLKKVRVEYGDIPFILFTGKGREEVVIEAINNGADFYLQK
jgi:DNA-binding response OmpR family regulator